MKTIFLSFFALLSFGIINAQKTVIFGAKSGINISVLTDDLSRANGRIGFVLGGFVELRLLEKLSLQPEIVYSSQGAQYREYSYYGFAETYNNSRINLMYVVVPIMAKYYVVDGVSLEFGPQFNFLAGGKLNYDSYTYAAGIEVFSGGSKDVKEYFDPIDYGLNFGAGFEFKENYIFNMRYTLGLENVLSNPAGYNFSSKNSVICFTVGYKFL